MKKNHIQPEEMFKVKKIFDFIKHKGKYFELSSQDGKTTFIEVPKKRVDDHLKKAKKLAKHLKSNLDAEKVLTEIFMTRYNQKELGKLYKTVFKSKRKYKARTREGACVDMKVGNHIIPIID